MVQLHQAMWNSRASSLASFAVWQALAALPASATACVVPPDEKRQFSGSYDAVVIASVSRLFNRNNVPFAVVNVDRWVSGAKVAKQFAMPLLPPSCSVGWPAKDLKQGNRIAVFFDLRDGLYRPVRWYPARVVEQWRRDVKISLATMPLDQQPIVSMCPAPLSKDFPLVSMMDYPLAALETRSGGTVDVIYRFNRAGRVAECKIVRSSDNAYLDRTTCRLITKRQGGSLMPGICPDWNRFRFEWVPPILRWQGLTVPISNSRDYPPSARRANIASTVSALLAIGTDGRVTACSIVQSTGSTLLNDTTCTLAIKRARFGRWPVQRTYFLRHVWRP